MTDATKQKILSIVNCFEMGTPHLQYDQITRLHDGPGKVLQFTGSFGVTEAYNLKKLIELYIAKGGKFADEYKPYLKDMGKKFTLANDSKFGLLWKKSAREDQLMRDAQDEIYEELYFIPAVKWCEQANFKTPLSHLVIFDSILQSGQILPFLRKRFAETTANEKSWVKAYTATRDKWLRTHSNKAVRNSAYRTKDLLKIIADGDWELEHPVIAHGTRIP